ncbi:hypothetical protein PR001_g12826 [Phytophthora rubi]|uniref:DUF6818 domain-containing protein n=1 Tax=Phytophthora rubi TaxID=129364 RepID=A0A6A3M624_9STRA|nr:hypothetical protein PR001_g12826 [Phytophthora rubi]
MTKRHGSTNYSIGEMRRLLELVQASLPASRADWEAVAADYNAVKEPQWKRRDAMSLKRKFRSMSLASHHGIGDARAHLASAASRVQQQMKLHRTPPRLQEIAQTLCQCESHAGMEPNAVSGSVAEAGDGVRARGWQAAAAHQQAVSGNVAEAGDGVRARGWQAATAHQQDAWLLVTRMAEMECPATWPKLVMVSALADGKLRRPTSKMRGSVSGNVGEAGDGVRARGWQAATAHQQDAWLLVTCMAEMEVLTIAMYIYGYDSCSSIRQRGRSW